MYGFGVPIVAAAVGAEEQDEVGWVCGDGVGGGGGCEGAGWEGEGGGRGFDEGCLSFGVLDYGDADDAYLND
ncbi:hypothetical protein EX30DRAFT_337530 [Ascodesmis nigricans]|uniref:Uncharacterized protein n=1 Tax=Ascodesmis nigricans TaxID=341454 RepID=A0A4S2N742_9PEZI|nr:hypothetical protein EX30DRAFT_337530 [Ascodesmis nigricans]